MSNLSGFVKRLRDIMRNDAGINGDAQRIEQIAWLLFLKVYATKEADWEWEDENYQSIIPEPCRWENWAAQKNGKEMTGDKLLDFVNNTLFPTLKNLPVDAGTPIRKAIVQSVFADANTYMKDGVLLRQVVNVIDELDLGDYQESHAFGEIYETILKELQSAGAAGEFYTPACVVRTLVEVIEPYHGRVYDPCCGSGGMFVQSAEFVKRHQGNIDDLSIYGQESNPTTWKMATMNLAIRGIDADLGKQNADTFFNDLHRTEKFDFILANPPFNLSDWGGDKLKEDPRWEYGVPPEGNANFAWVQHMVHHLNRSGRMGMVLANGSLSSQTNNEGEIRARLIEADLIEGIIAMPDKLFYSTGIPVSLWIITKKKAQPGKTLFIDARNMGTMVSRKLREFTEGDIAKVAGAFDAFRKGTLEEEKGFSAVASIEDIKEQDYIITPGRYVGIPDAEDDGEPFEEKMARLTGEIAKCFEESNRLQEQIKKNLEAIGYGM